MTKLWLKYIADNPRRLTLSNRSEVQLDERSLYPGALEKLLLVAICMILTAIGVVVEQYDRRLWYVYAAKLTLPHVFRTGLVLMLDCLRPRVFAK